MVPRARFVPGEWVGLADADEPVPIGHQQVTTQPSLVAQMVEALELSGGERVLEVGTGLGYQAAILGALSRTVYSIELLPDLAAQARDNLKAAGIDNVVVLVGDGALGLPGHAPYDAIVVSAASPSVPPALVEQLAEDGRLVQPMGRGGDETVTKFRKRHGRLVTAGAVTRARFVPLIVAAEGTRPTSHGPASDRGRTRAVPGPRARPAGPRRSPRPGWHPAADTDGEPRRDHGA
jgi:protein-L-isoaspartate(D-aspartate) O-methyltransferase